jgi:N-acetylmuramoyl-L-alanine amidase
MNWWKRPRAEPLQVLAAALLAGVAAAEPLSVVERIRYIGTVGYSRVVIDLSGRTAYAVSSVAGDGHATPVHRLVVDFAGARIGPEAQAPLTIGDALLQRIRTGQYTSRVARVVLDFRSAAEPRIFLLPDPYRLVIDVRTPLPLDAPEVPVRRLDSARRPDPSAGTPPARGASLPRAGRPLRVVVDPGHGGRDPGARGLDGVLEKDVVLDVARALARRLAGEPGVEVRLTREDDRTLSLEERTALANAAEADLFLSIHANASSHRHRRGVEVYYLNNTNNRGTLRLAAIENGLPWNPSDPSLAARIPDLSYILSDLRQTYKVEESRVLAERVGRSIVERLRGDWPGVPPPEVHEGPFYVLVGAHMPCVLVEISYLTHPVEGRLLASPSYREALAEGILEGVRRYWSETRMARTL